MIQVSAPGKIHLMGEHAVVYGMPALITAINLRLQVTISPSDAFTIEVNDLSAKNFMLYAIETVLKEYNIPSMKPCAYSVDSDIPFGYHLGSSAALAVATVGATIYYVKKLWNPQEINRLAYEVEKKQHGNPSGGDNTAVTFGGFLWYRKEFLKSMWQIPLTLKESTYHCLLVNTGKPEETTGEMVQLVSQQYEKNNEQMMQIFLENERQTKNIAKAIKDHDDHLFLQSIQIGEQTLEKMGVVSTEVQPFIREVEKNGGAAKILGGGGKNHAVGFLLVFHQQKEEIEHLAKQYSYTVQSVVLGEEGVRLESGKHE
jgi:mevalonate kinase